MKRNPVIFIAMSPVILIACVAAAVSEEVVRFATDFRERLRDLRK